VLRYARCYAGACALAGPAGGMASGQSVYDRHTLPLSAEPAAAGHSCLIVVVGDLCFVIPGARAIRSSISWLSVGRWLTIRFHELLQVLTAGCSSWTDDRGIWRSQDPYRQNRRTWLWIILVGRARDLLGPFVGDLWAVVKTRGAGLWMGHAVVSIEC